MARDKIAAVEESKGLRSESQVLRSELQSSEEHLGNQSKRIREMVSDKVSSTISKDIEVEKN